MAKQQIRDLKRSRLSFKYAEENIKKKSSSYKPIDLDRPPQDKKEKEGNNDDEEK